MQQLFKDYFESTKYCNHTNKWGFYYCHSFILSLQVSEDFTKDSNFRVSPFLSESFKPHNILKLYKELRGGRHIAAAAHEVSFEFVFPTIGFFTTFTIAMLEFLNGIEATPWLLYYNRIVYAVNASLWTGCVIFLADNCSHR